MSHNSSRLESYGHEKLEAPGLGNGMSYDIFSDNTILYG